MGWAIGDGKEHGDDPAYDAKEAEQLFNLLENEIIPEFYNRNEKGIPTDWVARMRESMVQLTPRFSADRTVKDLSLIHIFRFIPVFGCSNIFCRIIGVAKRNLCSVIIKSQCLENNENNIYHFLKFVFQLIRAAENVGIILRKAARCV